MHFYNYRLKKFLVSLTKMTWQRMMSCYWMSGIRLESYLMITSLITSLRIFNIQRYLLTLVSRYMSLTPDLISQVFVWIGKDANEVERTESVKAGEMQQAHIP